ncbi:unnamed protein product [Lactuca virosa]|nr:unnamed protein product [Lactuca virosa]
MVDAPTGYYDEAPGRMSAIYTAGMMARNRAEGETDVFVHDETLVIYLSFIVDSSLCSRKKRSCNYQI